MPSVPEAVAASADVANLGAIDNDPPAGGVERHLRAVERERAERPAGDPGVAANVDTWKAPSKRRLTRGAPGDRKRMHAEGRQPEPQIEIVDLAGEIVS